MKKLIVVIGLGILALPSCKEKPPYINLTACTPTILDTTYVTRTIPAAEPHNVLIEDFTGASCSNCPSAHDIILGIDTTHTGRINIIGLMPDDFSQTEPCPKSAYNFRSSVASLIEQQIFGSLYAMPNAGIDRMPLGDPQQGGIYQVVARGSWPDYVNTQLGVTDSINLSVVSTYDPTTQQATITTTVTYLQPSTALQSLSIAVVEDSFVDWQEDGFNYDSTYHFNDILRDLVTCNPAGSPILPAIPNKEAGRVATRTYLYKIDPAKWNPAHMRVIAFVTNASDGRHVYQSKQTKLAP